ncbi:MAG TPA: hypothetical protein VGS41_07995, partial [Chthonomonadales bacterium]|nr:hypothetical protein [Chthonomonadales bacterium]
SVQIGPQSAAVRIVNLAPGNTISLYNTTNGAPGVQVAGLTNVPYGSPSSGSSGSTLINGYAIITPASDTTNPVTQYRFNVDSSAGTTLATFGPAQLNAGHAYTLWVYPAPGANVETQNLLVTPSLDE